MSLRKSDAGFLFLLLLGVGSLATIAALCWIPLSACPACEGDGSTFFVNEKLLGFEIFQAGEGGINGPAIVTVSGCTECSGGGESSLLARWTWKPPAFHRLSVEYVNCMKCGGTKFVRDKPTGSLLQCPPCSGTGKLYVFRKR